MAGKTVKMLLLLSILFTARTVFAQKIRDVHGTVYSRDEKGEIQNIEGAIVLAYGTVNGTQTDKSGRFQIYLPDSTETLIVSYIGYRPDTLSIKTGANEISIELIRSHNLHEVVVRERLKSTEISMLNAIKTDNIGQGELQKAACCNLSESFETTPSIDIVFTDAVTGYKQIRMLGLMGQYTLITQENIPNVRGLGAITGLTFTPGAWIEGMQLSKGTGSVVNGYESFAGQLNIELKKPFEGEKWFFNVYQSTQGHSELNTIYRHKFNDKIATNLMVYANSQWLKTDQNFDHFLDQPLSRQLNILNRWIYYAPRGWMLQAGVKFIYNTGMGGEWNYKSGDPQVAGNPWGYQFTTIRLEDWAKVAKVFAQRPNTSIGLQLSNINHYQDGIYGPREYIGVQNSVYANLIFQTYINSTNHIIKAGMSAVMDLDNEQFVSINYRRNEKVPGIFGEYAYNYSDKFNIVAGLRGDYNNLYGGFATPRLHLRYAPFKKTVIRASTGRAQRTANILAENAGYMVGNRQFDVAFPQAGKAYGLNPEVAWTSGANLTHKFKIGLRDAVFAIDYYHTNFQSQVIADIDQPGYVIFYNLSGRSFANSCSAQFDYEIIHNLDLRLAYRYNKVMVTYESVLEEKPLTPASRAFISVDYETRNRWKFNYNIQWISTQRTPGITHNHGGITPARPNYSPSYIQMNAQITRVFSEVFEVYAGAENLTDYMQHDAIVDAANPYAKDFDASMIWGPMMGRNVYAGLRFRIKEKIQAH